MDKIYQQQINEITEHNIYAELAKLSLDDVNTKTLKIISNQELAHYNFWKEITKKEAKPNRWKIKKHIWLAKVFGLSFSLRLMEMGEVEASKFYNDVAKKYPKVLDIREEELQHEQKLIGILNDTRLNYSGSIVLGLNDALVEFTGTLAGITFAFSNNSIVGATGLIMGIAASLSMAASGYLSSKEEGVNEKINPITAAIYTGISYIITVLFLVVPYLIQDNPYVALGSMLVITILIIAGYNYYISVAKVISFKKRFWEMAVISLGVAAISFGIGVLIKQVFGIGV
ncbi:VIT1/CCC1 transporter family protein [Lutibacter sp.]|uniref:VIT1/CCC1 transporter family protein n=1 Tax=Lutibacter sp. TaxID=1925666 RepID=UPI0025BE6354|nr:VIT1/CCC1 transporter family protein [Lutibacter sp.]MCF6181227.1 VIT1/CCC1 transporter family protein [Lutibacter sp.]